MIPRVIGGRARSGKIGGGKRPTDTFGDHRCLFAVAHHQNGEFITAPASQGIGRPDNGPDQPGNRDQNRITGLVTDAVIDLLEFVQIEEQQAEGLP